MHTGGDADSDPGLWNSMPVFPSLQFSSVQFSCSIVILCDPMDCSMPGLPVHHQLRELIQTQVHQVASPPALNLSQHQGLFQLVSSSHQWPKY